MCTRREIDKDPDVTPLFRRGVELFRGGSPRCVREQDCDEIAIRNDGRLDCVRSFPHDGVTDLLLRPSQASRVLRDPVEQVRPIGNDLCDENSRASTRSRRRSDGEPDLIEAGRLVRLLRRELRPTEAVPIRDIPLRRVALDRDDPDTLRARSDPWPPPVQCVRPVGKPELGPRRATVIRLNEGDVETPAVIGLVARHPGLHPVSADRNEQRFLCPTDCDRLAIVVADLPRGAPGATAGPIIRREAGDGNGPWRRADRTENDERRCVGHEYRRLIRIDSRDGDRFSPCRSRIGTRESNEENEEEEKKLPIHFLLFRFLFLCGTESGHFFFLISLTRARQD